MDQVIVGVSVCQNGTGHGKTLSPQYSTFAFIDENRKKIDQGHEIRIFPPEFGKVNCSKRKGKKFPALLFRLRFIVGLLLIREVFLSRAPKPRLPRKQPMVHRCVFKLETAFDLMNDLP